MGKTLLLADDSVTIQKVVGISFASEDIAIKTVDNGDDAISRARELRPDIILADVVMPGKSGYEVCEAIKADPDLRHIPVLLLTGTFEAFDEDRAVRAGASGHIAKPFEAQTLVERVKQLLAQPPTVASVAPAAPAAPPAAQASAPAVEENAFDFFDDPAPETSASRADLEMDDAGDAFAFDEEDLGGPVEFASSPAAPPQPAAHTVAILPDAPENDDFGDDDLEPLAAESIGSALDSAPPPSPTHPTGSGEAFDFEFESMPSTAVSSLDDDPSEDFAESVLLDPAGDSAYDVSSSQLGDLSVEPEPAAAPESAPATVLFETPPPRPPSSVPPLQPQSPSAAAPPPLRPPQTRPPAARPAAPLAPPPSASAARSEAVMPPPLPRPGSAPHPTASDPLDAGAVEPRPSFVDEVPTLPPSPAPDPVRPAPAHAAGALPSAPVRAATGALPSAPVRSATGAGPSAPVQAATGAGPSAPVQAATGAGLDMPEAPAPIEPELPELSPLEPDDEPLATPARIRDDALAQIAPALREQLHETLEKIAWEAFGQVTETVVSQAVERLEKIAWEVVPKLAETLIAEEIRKLKEEA